MSLFPSFATLICESLPLIGYKGHSCLYLAEEEKMHAIKMICDRCGKEVSVHTSDLKETESKQPFYRCPNCHIGSLKKEVNAKKRISE